MADGVVKFGVGQPVRRVEDERFLKGAGRYVDDITLDGQAYAAFLRAPHPHALVRSVDLADARSAPGVLGAYASASFGLKPLRCVAPLKGVGDAPIAPVEFPHLATDRVRFVGQPVAMVVADTLRAAEDALERIVVDYQELPSVADARAALAADATPLHDVAPGNRAYEWEIGDADAVDAAFAAAAHRVSIRVTNQRLIIAAMEPRAINAAFDAEDGRWTLHCVSQGVHGMRARLSEQLGVEPDRLRVVTPDVGGGFGMKLMVHPEYAVVAAAARRLGRPVKWTATRTESFLSDAQGRDVDTDAEGAFDADGKLLAMRFTNYSNLGAVFQQVGPAVHTIFSAPIIGGMYNLPALYAKTYGAMTNTAPTEPYRGAGRPEMIYTTERVMDEAAHKIGLDPAEIRRRNLLTAADMPHPAPGGFTFDSGACAKVLEIALDRADYAGVAARKEAARAAGQALGVGVCYYMERTGGGPVENARLRVSGAGRIEAWIGTQSTGQGHETAWAQVIHERLGVPIDRIDFLPGDSDLLPQGGGTGGSRSLIMAHRVFFLAADDVIEQGRDAASVKLEAAVADIEYSAEAGGRFRIKGTDRSISLFDAAAAADASDAAEAGEILGVGHVDGRESTFPNGCHVAEALIDPETGVVKLTRYTIVDDFGVVLNPLLVEGQVHGGVVQGIGQALFETAAIDPETGQPLAASFMDYQLPRAADTPPMAMTLAEGAPATTNPLGVKGCGEAGCCGGIPAATLAVHDAMRALGAQPIETPLTPNRVWTALRAAGAGA